MSEFLKAINEKHNKTEEETGVKDQPASISINSIPQKENTINIFYLSYKNKKGFVSSGYKSGSRKALHKYRFQEKHLPATNPGVLKPIPQYCISGWEREILMKEEKQNKESKAVNILANVLQNQR